MALFRSLIPREDQEISNSQGSQKSVCDETIRSDTNISGIMTDDDRPVYTSQLRVESPMINLPTGHRDKGCFLENAIAPEINHHRLH